MLTWLIIEISFSYFWLHYKVTHMKVMNQVPPMLRALLLSARVIFVGWGVKADLLQIATAWNFSELSASVNMDHWSSIELGQFAKLKGCTVNAIISLSSLVGVCSKCQLTRMMPFVCLSGPLLSWCRSRRCMLLMMHMPHFRSGIHCYCGLLLVFQLLQRTQGNMLDFIMLESWLLGDIYLINHPIKFCQFYMAMMTLQRLSQ